MKAISMREIAKKLKILCNVTYYSLHRTVQTGSNQNRKSGRPWCTIEKEEKYIRVSSLGNRGPHKSSTGSFIK